MTQTFVSAVNGMKFDVHNPLTAELLSKPEKKDIVHKAPPVTGHVGAKNKRSKTASVPDDNEQEIG